MFAFPISNSKNGIKYFSPVRRNSRGKWFFEWMLFIIYLYLYTMIVINNVWDPLKGKEQERAWNPRLGSAT